MGWVRKIPPPDPHKCSPPMEQVLRYVTGGLDFSGKAPAGGQGSVWRCDDCGRLWQVNLWHANGIGDYLQWDEASWRNRRKYKVREVIWQ